MQDIVYLASVWLHIMAAVFWLGGMLFLAAVVVPGLARLEEPNLRRAVLGDVGRRFRTLGWLALAILVVTGFANAVFRWTLDNLTRPGFWSSDAGQLLGLKLALVLGMVLLSVVHDFVLGPRMTSGTGRPDPALRRRTVRLARLNAALGLVVVLIAAALVRLGH